MADLPDVDQSTVSFLAFWNAISDGEADSVDPSEVTSASRITSTTSYDNGVEGDYTLKNSRTARWRVKTDGWFVVWLDRTHDLSNNRDDHDILYWNGVKDIPDTDTYPSVGQTERPDLQQNAMADAIQDLQSQLSNSASITFNHTDVGLNNYERSEATTTTMLNDRLGATTTLSLTATVQSDTTTYQYLVPHQLAGDDSSSYISFDYEGSQFASYSPGSGWNYDVYDPSNDGLIPSPGTAADFTVETGTQSSSGLTLFVIWG